MHKVFVMGKDLRNVTAKETAKRHVHALRKVYIAIVLAIVNMEKIVNAKLLAVKILLNS